MTQSSIALLAVYAIVGLFAGEIADVWCDMTHAEVDAETGVETIELAPRRFLAFGYGKTYFSDILLTPEAFEHYHWSLWLGANAITASSFAPTIASMMVGTAISLALDENRRGLADKPFGVGKPSFTANAIIAVILVVALVLRIASVSTPYEQAVSLCTVVLPFALLALLWVFQKRGHQG